MSVCLFLCLYRMISLTAEPIGFALTRQLVLGSLLIILGKGTSTIPRQIAPRKSMNSTYQGSFTLVLRLNHLFIFIFIFIMYGLRLFMLICSTQGSVFKGIKKRQKNSIKPSKDLHLKINSFSQVLGRFITFKIRVIPPFQEKQLVERKKYFCPKLFFSFTS